MQFNSIEFFIFLPIVFLLYWFVFNRNLKLQNLFVLIISYIFYGWWNWKLLFLIAFTSFCSWYSGLLIEKFRDKAKLINGLNISVNLIILAIFKYYNFFVQSFADIFRYGNSDGLLLNVMLPVGISFYTFQALSYSIDVYRNNIQPTKDIVQFFAFVSFFPQLVAGPIERATNLLPQFQKTRNLNYEQLTGGLRQALWGFFKKVVIADNLAVYVNIVFNDIHTYSGFPLMWATLFFMFQIYADFSGYSDIAIGIARIFGFKLMENFRRPYLSRSIKEFWNRWHISLSSWFRDYVYIPLGGNRVSMSRHFYNLFITFLISGLWHGANWTFVLWGSYYGGLLVLERILHIKSYRITDKYSICQVPRLIIVFFLVFLGWGLFRSNSITDAYYLFTHLFDINSGIIGVPIISTKTFITLLILVVFVFIVDCIKEFTVKCYHKKILIYVWVAFLIASIYILGKFEEQSFIYFQF